MLAVGQNRACYSMFGDSYVYVIFEDGTDIYWARSRVLEYLESDRQPFTTNVQPSLGPRCVWCWLGV